MKVSLTAVVTAIHEAIQRGSACVTLHIAVVFSITLSRSETMINLFDFYMYGYLLTVKIENPKHRSSHNGSISSEIPSEGRELLLTILWHHAVCTDRELSHTSVAAECGSSRNRGLPRTCDVVLPIPIPPVVHSNSANITNICLGLIKTFLIA